MSDLDYIAQTLLHIVLRPGFDIDMMKLTDKGTTGFSIYWHRTEAGEWYPSIEIEHGDATIYAMVGQARQGKYNWASFRQDAADYVYDYQYDRLQEATGAAE